MDWIKIHMYYVAYIRITLKCEYWLGVLQAEKLKLPTPLFWWFLTYNLQCRVIFPLGPLGRRFHLSLGPFAENIGQNDNA